MNYIGKIVEAKYGGKTRYELISYIGEVLGDIANNPNGRILLSKDNKTYQFEYWLCRRLSDNNEVILSIQTESVPLERSKDHCDEGFDRLPGQYINDKWEVNLLTDSYDEWINNKRDLTLVDRGLTKAKKDLRELINFLESEWKRRASQSSKHKDPLRVGFKLLFVHRSHPQWCGHKVFKQWCRDNPVHHEKMKRIINDWLKSKKTGSSESGI